MRALVRKAGFGVLGAVLLCLPATAWAVPLDNAVTDTTVAQKPALEAPKLSRDIADPRKELLVSIGHDTAILEPNAPYEIFLDNTSLGVYESDQNGQLFVQVKLPNNIASGHHTLAVAGDEVRVSKTVRLLDYQGL